MSTPVATIDARATLRQAARALRDANVGTLAIVAHEEVTGIVSERDVVRAIADEADPDEIWVADVMSGSPRYLTTADTVRGAIDVMLNAGFRHLPVMEDGELVGIVSLRGLARALS
jgi:CBS domain-containing protein